MSNSLAIAAVTAALQQLLTRACVSLPGDPDGEMGNSKVTTMPPDKARSGTEDPQYNQLNLFLYHASTNPAWRNRDLPTQTKRGETGQPPAALDLHYFLTAYAHGNNDLLAQRLLGRAIEILQDCPVLPLDLLQSAQPGSDVHRQLERVRVSPATVSMEELSRMWSTFQAPYRLTVVYQVSVVLIESTRPVVTPLPVLRRGAQDQGVMLQPSMTSSMPSLGAIVLPSSQPAALLGDATNNLPADVLTLLGTNLNGTQLELRLTHTSLAASQTLTSGFAILPGGLSVPLPVLPSAQTSLPAGIYSVAVARVDLPDPAQPGASLQRRVTSAVPVAIAPRIQPGQLTVNANTGMTTLALSCSPPVWPTQRVSLLLGAREIPAEQAMLPKTQPSGQLQFTFPTPAPGPYFVRLRVDGVDSLVVKYGATPTFDPAMQVTIP